MRRCLVVVCLFVLAASVSAATFDLPSDRVLLDRAEVVVVGTVVNSTARQGSDGLIYTDHQLLIEQTLKGQSASTIVVSEAGGFLDGRGTFISGTAEYESGSRVLSFLRRRADGTYFTAYMGLGVYHFAGKELIRTATGIETLGGEPRQIRDAVAFVDAIRDGEPELAAHVVPAELRNGTPRADAVPTAASYLMTETSGSATHAERWPGCESNCFIPYLYNGSQPGIASPPTSIGNAMDVWNDDPNSGINLAIGSQDLVNNDYALDGDNLILLSYTGGEPGFCNGAVACGIAHIAGPNHNFEGDTFWTIAEGDVIIKATLSAASFERVLAHELGHTIGFRHSNQTGRTPFSTNALMNSVVPPGLSLRRWDRMAVATAYGNGYPCETFSVNVAGGGNVTFGEKKTLTATPTGPTDASYTYQWYEGATGNTTTPVSTSASFTTPNITVERQYWVRVTIDCGSSADSATITVTPQNCDAATIMTQTQNHQIAPNSTTILAITASGTSPLTIRWYRANAVGDTSMQVATTASFTTPALTQTTSYWARVSNNCGQDDTTLITITVTDDPVCVQPSITSQSPSLTVQQDQGATISVTATGNAPFTYQWYQGEAPNITQPIAGATSQSYAAGPFTIPGEYKFWAKVTNQCGSANSNTITITLGCPAIALPLASTPARSHFANGYNVTWTGSVATSTFEVQEATDAAFTQNVQTFPVSGALSRSIAPHLEIPEDTRFYYRVRALPICTGQQPTAWSNTTTTVVTSPLPSDSDAFAFSVSAGSVQSFTQDMLVPGFGETAHANDTFAITTDVPWITVFPPAGALSAGGTTVQITVNPTGLEVGSTTGTIQISRTPGTAANAVATHDGPVTTSLPLGLSLVTPVSPDPRDGNPPPGTLIIPAVAHAQGIGSPFRSDVRIVNVSFSDIDYEISYTPSGLDGLQAGKKTTVTIRSGDVLALDDLVASWFGAGMLGEGGIGTIEIRPLNSGNPLDTFASSRTYALAGGGTLGQFIPALRTNQFIGNFAQDTLSRISLQMIAASADYRTNVGFVEGTGAPVQFLARLVDGNNNVLGTYNGALPPFGHLQRSVPDLFGGVNLNDGRVEVEVTSAGGKVSAYASVVNNQTNDPLLVFPVQPARTTAERYVVAGIAELTGGSNFHSDMRIYNAGSSAVTATLNFHPFGAETPSVAPVQVTLNPGEVRAIDDVLPTLWPGLSGGGSVIATTNAPSSLVVTAQTFSLQPDGGTKGQFIPGVTFREAAGIGDRPLEVLQLEQSDQYRSNVGFVEVTGKPALIEVTAFEPDTKASRVTQIPLKANEYVQYARFLSQMGLGTVYNGRVSVKVVSGEGRVYAYGSTVDNDTEDPTYVPAQ
jgi:hypothetical protein